MGTLILILVVLVVGICVGFMIGFSRAMREAASRVHGTKRPTIAKIVVGLGCACLIAALATALHTWNFTRVAKRTGGTIIEMREQTDKESGDKTYAPTFSFQDASGAQHTVSSSFYSAPPEFQVGEGVTVLYRSDDPKSARIDSYWQVWGLPGLLGITGSMELAAGIIVLCWPKIIARFRRPTLLVPSV